MFSRRKLGDLLAMFGGVAEVLTGVDWGFVCTCWSTTSRAAGGNRVGAEGTSPSDHHSQPFSSDKETFNRSARGIQASGRDSTPTPRRNDVDGFTRPFSTRHLTALHTPSEFEAGK
ncbi:uncharacterized protein LACBIDRAFT_318090 [Laccaria bicolor S238N-H82]|uniref:Predicted protein n=1 Tax=Laccaria bicolor (strain S238N-H82 / ATCC MYA-4686) TaxID=486041 RepID=B0D5Y6_LACBS|nr:uncharacterized protein LACBIDRAFT_318090 [Laccaria bicolor S238N-H82]EDR09849.1 predicted protein [Laccaria bicolor S238N-H82]|eukprot:XP_001879234.1 predicted protein [Laccaria bicolor S238N-H82]